jgi:hypothetical protein
LKKRREKGKGRTQAEPAQGLDSYAPRRRIATGGQLKQQWKDRRISNVSHEGGSPKAVDAPRFNLLPKVSVQNMLQEVQMGIPVDLPKVLIVAEGLI